MSTVYNDPIMLDSTGQDIVTKLDSIASLMGDGVIDDTSTATDTTWSSNKITSELAGKQDELTFDHTPKDDSLNPVYSDGIYDSIIGVYDNLELGLGWDSKNILGIANTSKEVNGITFTVNDDGTVKLNGTATSATLYALNKFTGAELKKYGVNLLMTGGKDNSTFLTLMTQDWSYTKDDKGDGVEINISELIDATEYTVIIQIANGTTLSNYVMSPMIRLANVIDPSFKKHHDSVDVIKADKVNVIANTKLIKDTVGWSGKNKIYPTLTSTSSGGVTLTGNLDGSVTLNGNSTSRTYPGVVRKEDNIFNLEYEKEYILTGSNLNLGVTIYVTWRNADDTDWDGTAQDTGNGVKFAIPQNRKWGVYLIIPNGLSFNNNKIYPMIRDADILDDTYEPYFGSTAFPRSEQAVLGAKNLWENSYVSQTLTGIDWTVYDDGKMNANGTTTTGTSFLNTDEFTLPFAGRFKATCELNQTIGTDKFRWFIYNVTKSQDAAAIEGDGWFDYNGTDKLSWRFSVRNAGTTVNNLLMAPMISLDGGEYAPYAMTNKELTEKFSLQNATSLLTAETGVTIGNIYKAKVGNLVTYSVVISTTSEKAANSRLLAGWDNPEPLNDGILTGHLYASGTLYKVMFTISNSQAFLQTMETIPSGASLRGTFTYITKAAEGSY